MHIILASQSPRRLQLLSQIGITAQVQPADIDETAWPQEAPADYVLRLAIAKAQAVCGLQSGDLKVPILAADTTVALGDAILGKPIDDTEAKETLQRLSGTVHVVHTAIAVATPKRVLSALNTSLVTFCALTDAMIAAYLQSGEHRDKAGSYGIQGLAGAWVSRLEGSYSGVMGLPLFEAAQLLEQAKQDF